MKTLCLVWILILISHAKGVLADGLIPMNLEEVLSQAETVLEIEVQHAVHTEQLRKEGDEIRSVKWRSTFEGNVLGVLKGMSEEKVVNVVYTSVVVKGVWTQTTFSGAERHLRKGDRCFVFYRKDGGVLRMEKVEVREELLKLLKLEKENR